MHTLLAVGVTILTATAPSQTQASLATTKPLSIMFVNTVKFEDAVSSLARVAGVTIEFDQTVTADILRSDVSTSPLNMRDVSPEEAIGFLTQLKGLSYSVIDGTTVRIFKKA